MAAASLDAGIGFTQATGRVWLAHWPSGTPLAMSPLMAPLDEAGHQINGQGQNPRIEGKRKETVNPDQPPQALGGDLDIRDLRGHGGSVTL